MDMDNRKRRICCFCEKWESGGIESFMQKFIMENDMSQQEIDYINFLSSVDYYADKEK